MYDYLTPDLLTDELVTVRFAQPVEGADPDDGEAFVASRHRVLASWMRQDRRDTAFIDESGEIVGCWATDLIEQIDWAPAATLSVLGRPPRIDPGERLRALRERHPNAYHKWEPDEDEQLADEFRSGLTVPEMVERHGRAGGGIMARLRHLQLIEQGTPASAVGRPPAPEPEVAAVTTLPVPDALAS
jgi:hypothetical protein